MFKWILAALLLLPGLALAQRQLPSPDSTTAQNVGVFCFTSDHSALTFPDTPGAICAKITGTVTLGPGSAAIGSVAVSSLPALPAGSNAIGAVSVSNLPATQPVSGTVTTTPPAASVSDCSTTLTVAGTAYQLVASGTARKSILLQNIGSGNAGFSFTSTTPSIGSAGTFTLPTLASFNTPPGFTQTAALYAVGTVAGQVVTCTVFQ